jgi:hypothetical protein
MSRGIWLFFDEARFVTTVRFDPPFAGSIGGVCVGDAVDRVRAALGKPNRKWPVDDGVPRWFYDVIGLRLDFDPSLKVLQTIFLL